MGRWAHLDSDEERLPEHFKRVGYDADSETYTFVDTSTGKYYESAPGNRYGVLRPIEQSSPSFERRSSIARDSATHRSPSSPTSNEASPFITSGSPSTPTDPKRLWEEIDAHNDHIRKQNKEAVRLMLPFALLVLLFLLLVFKFVNSGAGADDDHNQVQCADGYQKIQVRKGETCWAIAETYGLGVDALLGIAGNEGIDCDRLGVGQGICVPA